MAARWFRVPWSRSGGGAQVSGYRLLHEIGSGGFSTVYAADDLGAGRRVALKLARSRDRDAQAKFDAEAAIGERLVSARGIVGTLERTRTRDGRPVLVMPYYDLGTAADLLADGARLPVPEVVDLVQEVAQGLDAMHRQHYLHRDISPRNILRSNELGSALGDLGCARAFNSTTQPPWTQALTPGYAAPETVAAVGVQSIASDVYGLAATAWALFAGAPPYGRPPEQQALQSVARYELLRNSAPPPVAPLQAVGLPEPAVQVLTQALDPDPARRPGRVMDFSAALAAALGTSTGRSGQRGRVASDSQGTSRAGDAAAPGPIQPPSVRAAGADQTELADQQAKSPSKDRSKKPAKRRRWPVIVAVPACFVLSFAAVRVLSGPDSTPKDPPASPTATTGPRPGDYGGVAPRDLRIVRTSARAVDLRWTPPTDPDAVAVLYRAGADRRWAQVSVDLTGAKGKARVPVKATGGPYCYLLVVVVGASRGFTSNAACPQGR